MDDIAQPIVLGSATKDEVQPVTITVIANGYIVSRWANNIYEQWYCIDEHEVHQKLRKMLF